MKCLITLLTIFVTLSSFASTLNEDLKNKSCSLEFSKTVFVNESDAMTQLGQVMFAPLINERNLLIKKGLKYQITESDDQVIVINERENIVFLCITDDSLECRNISEIDSTEVSALSANQLKLTCE